jgi:hypothetical protein
MEPIRSTREVAGLLGLPVSRLTRALWLRQFVVPTKSPAGDYLWTRKDMERASWALLHRDLDRVLAARHTEKDGGPAHA